MKKHTAEPLRGAWRQVYVTGTPLTIPCGTPGMAVKLRFDLYRAVKPVREGKEFDELVTRALREVQVVIEGSDCILRRKPLHATSQKLAGLLDPRFALSLEEQAARQSQGDLLIAQAGLRLAAPQGASPNERQPAGTTPYYTR